VIRRLLTRHKAESSAFNSPVFPAPLRELRGNEKTQAANTLKEKKQKNWEVTTETQINLERKKELAAERESEKEIRKFWSWDDTLDGVEQ